VEAGEAPWPLNLALATLAGVTVLVALVIEIFVESVRQAAVTLGMAPAFVGFIIVALVAVRPRWLRRFLPRAKIGWI
jgi:Ca2+:H+ antiporter